MAAPYVRTAAQKAGDFARSKAFEELVQSHLPGDTVVRTNSTTELDFFVPGITLEVKEKVQPLTNRWVPDTFWPEQDCFVLDELTVRKALKHWPFVWFLFRDVPRDRLFVASISQVVSADRVRWDRNGKGKWVLYLPQFRQIPSLEALLPAISEDASAEPWRASSCIVPAPEV